MKLDANNISDSITQLLTLRKYAPFRFGGKWFVSVINGGAVAYRSKTQLLKAAAKAGVTKLELAIIE